MTDSPTSATVLSFAAMRQAKASNKQSARSTKEVEAKATDIWALEPGTSIVIPLFQAFGVMCYLSVADRFPAARRELENVCAQAMDRVVKPLMVAISPATFECVRAIDWQEACEDMHRLFVAELRGENATPA